MILLILPLPAYAYLDPGTGAMIIQAIVAVFAGAVFFIKSNWNKLRGIKQQGSDDEEKESVDSNEDEINKAS